MLILMVSCIRFLKNRGKKARRKGGTFVLELMITLVVFLFVLEI